MLALLTTLMIAAATPQDPALERELVGMEAASHVDFDAFEAVGRRKIWQANARRLREIVAKRGWPGFALVGSDGATAALRIVLQSNDDALLREMLPRVQAAAARHDVPMPRVASLIDRVLRLDGKPQRYGTQVDGSNGEPRLVQPVEDPAHLDERRKAMGLGPSAAELARLAQQEKLAASIKASRAHDLPLAELHDELLALQSTYWHQPDQRGGHTPMQRACVDAMRAILTRYGWPDQARVGKDGEEAAWDLVVAYDAELQRQALPLLDAASRKGEVPRSWWATLVDRIQMVEHGTQRYGSLVTSQRGRDELSCRLEDPTHTDQLRASVGLPPLAKGIGVYGE